MGIHEIRVLGDYDPLLHDGDLVDNRVFRMIACGKIQRVRCIMSTICKKSTEAAWKVRIEKKFHVKAR